MAAIQRKDNERIQNHCGLRIEQRRIHRFIIDVSDFSIQFIHSALTRLPIKNKIQQTMTMENTVENKQTIYQQHIDGLSELDINCYKFQRWQENTWISPGARMFTARTFTFGASVPKIEFTTQKLRKTIKTITWLRMPPHREHTESELVLKILTSSFWTVHIAVK